jgi:hypothetical protein
VRVISPRNIIHALAIYIISHLDLISIYLVSLIYVVAITQSVIKLAISILLFTRTQSHAEQEPTQHISHTYFTFTYM